VFLSSLCSVHVVNAFVSSAAKKITLHAAVRRSNWSMSSFLDYNFTFFYSLFLFLSMQQFDQEGLNDSLMNAKWIVVNTKSCPNCQNHIEKNDGCNHMTCRTCRHEFCWICMVNWKGHSCPSNTFNNPDRQNLKVNIEFSESEMAMATLDLKRYVHYFERYNAHKKSIKFAEEQKRKLKSTICI
jgi:hypothetical protein